MTKRYYKCAETHQTVNGIELKRCTKCKRWKEVSEFNKDRARKDGLRIYCKSCNYSYFLKHRRKNKKPIRAYLRYEDRHRVIRGFKEKLCSRCKQWKYYSEFHKNSRTKDGLSGWCKKCEKKSTGYKRKSDRKYIRYEDRHRVVNGQKEKLCSKCEKWKAENQFVRDRSNRDGLGAWCRACSYKTNGKSHRLKKSMRRNLRYEERHRVINGVKQKYCRQCKRWKPENEFYKNRSSKDGLNSSCKECSCKATIKPYKAKKSVERNMRYENRHRVVNGIRQKYCRKCKNWKSEHEFYRDKSKKDGLMEQCQKCSYKPVKKSRKKRPAVKK